MKFCFSSGESLWRNLRHNFRACFAKYWSPQKVCHRTSTTNFTTSLAENLVVCHNPAVGGSGKAESRKFQCQAQTQGGGEVGGTGGSGSHSIDREQFSATSVSGTWFKREMAGALGQLACSLNVSWVAWSAHDGHHLQVPITCRLRAPKCQVPLIY